MQLLWCLFTYLFCLIWRLLKTDFMHRMTRPECFRHFFSLLVSILCFNLLWALVCLVLWAVPMLPCPHTFHYLLWSASSYSRWPFGMYDLKFQLICSYPIYSLPLSVFTMYKFVCFCFVLLLLNLQRFLHTMRAIQGALISSSSIQIVLGFSGLWGIVTRLGMKVH